MKNSVTDLAINGGSPAFTEKLHVGRPNIGDKKKLLERFEAMLDSRWLTNNGPNVQELEQCIADFLNVKHCIAVCNGQSGLELAIRGLDLHGEVIVPSFTFVATAHALQWQEITPVFCDINPDTYTIDPECIEALLTPKTSGIIGVHLWGRACDIDPLQALADKHNLQLMFDAAHAFYSSYKGTMIGNFGKAEVFSFHATKFFNTFEGGAITTNDDELAQKFRLMKNFGFSGYDNVIYLGSNCKMNEACAVMGLSSLESIDQFVETNKLNYQHYQQGLQNIPGLSLIDYDDSEIRNYQYIIMQIHEQDFGVNRDRLQEILMAENVIARRYFYPGCHNMEPYKSYYPHSKLRLPQTEALNQRVLALPTGTAISQNDIETICQIIRFVNQQSSHL